MEAHARAGGLVPRRWPLREAVASRPEGKFPPVSSYVLGPEVLARYVERFNRLDRETVVNLIPDSAAGDWLLWYNGRRGSEERIGLAVPEGEDLGFPEGGR